jgi:5'(3')-deoxyribonucleotidase
MKIYIDLDGVMADFDTHYDFLLGTKFDNLILCEEEKTAKWRALDPHPTFFRDLPLMPGAMKLWAALVDAGYEPIILSAATRRIETCSAQKREWVKEYLGLEGEDRVIIVANKRDKAQYCQPGDVLIDDHSGNIAAWTAAGGHGILFVSADQTIADFNSYISLDMQPVS